jgi:uncharacterized protein YkwD
MPIPVTLNQPELALVRVVNRERTAHGLTALRPIRSLTRVARVHSRDQMRHGTFGHTSSDGASFRRRLARYGRHGVAGEVVAWTGGHGHATATRIVRMWMSSPPHRAELLNPRFHTLGVGRARSSSGTWITADLAAR